MRISWVLLLTSVCFAESRFPFQVAQPAEVLADIEMSSPGSDWAKKGSEAAVASIRVAGKPDQQVILFAGPQKYGYRIFLGALAAGSYELRIDRDASASAASSELKVHGASFRQIVRGSPDFDVYANAPILYARPNTAGKFSDIPLLIYAERSSRGLTYTVVFSNEDGGTSTRALMARWGRATDIEYVYTVMDGKAIVQGPGHQDIEFKGRLESLHPLLMPITDNNMIQAATGQGLRFQPAPILVDLSNASREQVMDDASVLYQVMAKELIREDKLRPFGVVAAEKISDPRNYLFVEYKAEHQDSFFTVAVQTKDGRSFSSDLGRVDYAIARDGWVRTTIELPPKTGKADVKAIEFRCSVQPKAHSGQCRLDGVNKVFFLDSDYLPAASIWSLRTPVKIDTGQSVYFQPR